MTQQQAAVDYDPMAVYDVQSFDVEYRSDGESAWLARIFQPKGNGLFPALLDVHGGAWANGDRLMNESTDLALAATGLVVAAIDFRTSRQAAHPAAMQDISYATRWLKLHAGDFNASGEALGGAGWSSGGHQLMLSAMRPSVYGDLPLAGTGEMDASLRYVIMGWPVIDPLARYRLAASRGNEELMANHRAYFGDEAGMEEASPPHILARGETAELPPALLVQGAMDDALPRMMAEEFAEAYSLAGGVIELAKYPAEPHGFLRQPGLNSERALELIESFIARQLTS
jgi:acetyl esterase